MKKSTLLLGAVLLVLLAVSRGDGAPPCCGPTVTCQPGYTIVQETVYQDVIRKVCRQTTEPKKKWVYSTREVDYCVPTCHCMRHPHQNVAGCAECESCRQCGKLHTKCVLVKKQVDDCPITKCVVDYVVDKVPCVVCKKVPCAAPICPPPPAPVMRTPMLPPSTRASLLEPVDVRPTATLEEPVDVPSEQE